MQHAVAPSLLCKLCRGSVAVFAASTRSRPRYATLSAAASTSQSPGTSQRRARQRPVIWRSIHASAEKARYRQPAVLEANSDVEGRAATDALSTPRVRNLKELYDTSGKKKRPILYNNETAKTVAGKIRQGARRLTVVDLYAAHGLVSKALLENRNVETVVAFERTAKYQDELQDLVTNSAGRFAHVALDPFWWDSFSVTKERGLLDRVETLPWEEDHLGLALVGCIPDNMNAERMVFQQLTCIPERMWLYEYGRFSSYLMVSDNLAKRMQAKVGDPAYHKVAVILSCLVDIKPLIPPLSPLREHFEGVARRIYNHKADAAYIYLRITPKKEPLLKSQEELEALEYLTKNLFIHRATSWPDALKYLAPGADIIPSLIEKQGHSVDRKKLPRQLTTQEWIHMLHAFLDWPFRPKDLEQSDIRDSADGSQE